MVADSVEKDAEAAWIEYRNGVQMRTPWENHRRAMRRLRKRDFIAGYLAAARVIPPVSCGCPVSGFGYRHHRHPCSRAGENEYVIPPEVTHD